MIPGAAVAALLACALVTPASAAPTRAADGLDGAGLSRLDGDGDRVADRFAKTADWATVSADPELLLAIVRLDRAPTAEDEDAVEALGGLVLQRWERLLHGLYVALPPEMVKEYAASPHVVWVDADHPGRATMVTATQQSAVRAVWQGAGPLLPWRGRAEHRIAVLDSGIDDSHPALRYAAGGWRDLIETGNTSPEDRLGHGTMVAGIAAGTGAMPTANQLDITFTGLFPSPEGTAATFTYPIRTGSSGRALASTLYWEAAAGSHRITFSSETGQVGSLAGATDPLVASTTVIGNSEAFRVAFASQTGDAGNTAGTFFQGQVRTPYNAYDSDPLLAGVAPGASIVGARIVDDTGATSSSRIIDGLEWVATNRATLQIVVVNLSVTLDGGTLDPTVDAAVNSLVDRGVAVVVAAGNGQQVPAYIGSPGTAANAITVGATNHLDQTTFYTSIGDPSRAAKPDLVAPGGSDAALGTANTRPIIGPDSNDADAARSGTTYTIQTDTFANDYAAGYGTSYAAAMVAGAVALIADARSGWAWYEPHPSDANFFAEAPLSAKSLLTMTATEVQAGETSASGLSVVSPGPPGRAAAPQDRTEGFGRLNVQAALETFTLPFRASEGNATLGSAPTSRKAWGRYVDLGAGQQVTAHMTVGPALDADLYLYDAVPLSNGTPRMLRSSTGGVGSTETISYTATAAGRYYLVAKWVSGDGSATVVATSPETCDGIDNDNDGQTDEAAPGVPLSRTCWDGSAPTRNVGTCHDGVQTCSGGTWGPCIGQVLPNGPTRWRAEYYNGMDFRSGALYALAEVAELQFDAVPTGFHPGLDADFFAARWASQLCVATSGSYRLRITADCRFSLTIGLTPGVTTIISDDGNCQSAPQVSEAAVTLNPGCYPLVATYRHGHGDATFRLHVMPPAAAWLSLTGVWTQQSPVLCDGLDDDCEGDPETVDFPTLGRLCDGPDVDECQNGTWTCRPDQLGVECVNEHPTDILEQCNGLDDDCDGSIDESLTGGILRRTCWDGPPSVAGTGVCVAGEEACLNARWTGLCVGQVFPNGATGFLATYFAAQDLTDAVAQQPLDMVQQTANETGFDPAQPADHFSMRYETELCVGVAGTYTLYGTADDGQRLYLDLGDGPTVLFEDWEANGAPTEVSGSLDLAPGCYRLTFEMFDETGGAEAQLEFSGPGLPRQLLAAPYAWRRFEAACDYVDDDCDGTTDEDWVVGVPCDGDDKDLCENGRTECSADGTVTVCGAEHPADIDEVCNGLDDDCDGTTDEIFPLGDACTVGLGACLREGVYVCDAAQVGHVCDTQPGTPTEELCNGIDDDCDGLTDEDAAGDPLTQPCYEGPPGTEGVGICVGGTRTCADGEWGPCEGQQRPLGTRTGGWQVQWFAGKWLQGEPIVTGRVASIDFDLAGDESPHEGVPGDFFSGRFTGTLCAPVTGDYVFYATSDDGQRLSLDLGAGLVPVIDIWQDRAATEDSVAVTLSAGCHLIRYEFYDALVYAFARLEIESDDAGIERQLLAAPLVTDAVEAYCDGQDDDCDGAVDEEYPLGVACDGPDGDQCANGVYECAADGVGYVCGVEDPTDLVELCNGVDDDCDGETDEDDAGALLTRPCYTGPAETLDVGICAAGLSTCSGGDWAPCVGDVTPGEGWRAFFYDGPSLDTLVGEAIVPWVGYDLAEGPLDERQEADEISARFETAVCVPADGTYRFRVEAGEGQRVYVDVGTGWLVVVDAWAPDAGAPRTFTLFLAAGCTPLRYEWFDLAGARFARFEIEGGSGFEPLDGTWTARPSELCNGLDDDCDGSTDESGAVDDVTGDPLPLVEACYDGPAVTLGVGTCAEGERVCGDGAWEPCDGGAPADFAPGFVISWFATPDPTGEPVATTSAPFLDLHVGVDEAPTSGLPNDGWSARAEGQLCLEGPVSTLRFVSTHDDGARLWIDRGDGFELIIDSWGPDSVRAVDSAQQALTAGCHPLRYEFWDDSLEATAKLEFVALELDVPLQLVAYPRLWQLAEGLCDGVDDDCDGVADDEWLAFFDVPCDGNDSDLCENGTLVCAPDGLGVTCGPESPANLEELCNGVDDDCDGQTDEDYPLLGAACDGDDADFCATGTWECAPDELGVACLNESGVARVELCDGVDNDCDGLTDEDFPELGQPCDGDDSDQCENGVFVCALDGSGVICGPENPSGIAETCNGRDDDCDGDTDEGLGTTQCGLGLCDHVVANCENGQLQTCDPLEGAGIEICDGYDNDCDGDVDEEDAGALCVDLNLCTDDACGGFLGCQYTNNTADCDDGNACTAGDQCAAGVCVPGAAVSCDDDDVCTDDSCHPATGCVFTNNTAACSDGNACTAGDVCANGVCTAGAPVVCDDENVCTDDSCDPATGCVHANNTAACDDGSACTAGDVCAGGACTGGAAVDCDDGNVCTDDSCDPATGCVNADNSAACEDGDACTAGDICAAGACLAGAAVDCDDDNVCTDDSCDPATGCVHAANTAACDDGSACTEGDVCAAGACAAGAAVDCDDADVCTTDACDPATGCTHEAVEGCCEADEDCTGDKEFCVVDEHRCAPGVCAACEADEDCGGEGDLCVALPSGLWCGRDCSAGQECPPATTCTTLDDGARQCLPVAGDCECLPAATRACHGGDVVAFSSCGEAGDVVADCAGRGCVDAACCPAGTALDETSGVCETTGGGDDVGRPDVHEGDVPTQGDGVTIEDSGGPGADTGGGGGGGGGGCAAAPTTAGGPLAAAALALLALALVALRRRRAR
jgi:hypothetical protein